MNQMERIDIKQFDLANEKVVKPKWLYVELLENALIYTGNFISSVSSIDDDPLSGWEEQPTFFRHKIKRSALISVELMWKQKRQNYVVEMEAAGYPLPIVLHFQTKKEAEDVYERLDKYIFQV